MERTLLAYFLIAGGLSLVGTISGEIVASGWALVAVNALFVAVYGFVLVREPQPGKPARGE